MYLCVNNLIFYNTHVLTIIKVFILTPDVHILYIACTYILLPMGWYLILQWKISELIWIRQAKKIKKTWKTQTHGRSEVNCKPRHSSEVRRSLMKSTRDKTSTQLKIEAGENEPNYWNRVTRRQNARWQVQSSYFLDGVWISNNYFF